MSNHRKYWSSFQRYAYDNAEFVRNFKQREPSNDGTLYFAINDIYSSDLRMCLKRSEIYETLSVGVLIPDNKRFATYLLNHKNEIENEFGGLGNLIDWNVSSSNNSSTITVETDHFYVNSEGSWEEQFDWLVNMMLIFVRIFRHWLLKYDGGKG